MGVMPGDEGRFWTFSQEHCLVLLTLQREVNLV